MKEITRIHIAKVAYDIELNAKKELENYIAALERYAGDKELLDDIEIRITELLAERGVQADGVISSDDVAAVRAQLGEPSDFAPEGEEAVQELNNEPRRVYRDEEGAVLGGVLSGFARFFGIDPLWVRLLFIVLLFGSFGTALLVYIILWLIIPPARTSAEKLRMSGKPVTLASIKQLAGSEERQSEVARTTRRVLSVSTGMILLLSGIGFLMFTAMVAIRVLFDIGSFPMESFLQPEVGAPWWIIAAFGLFVLAGLLLSALCFILASSLFRQAWSKRIGTAVIAVIAAGLIAFTGGIATMGYGQFDIQTQMNKDRRTSYINLPANFASVKNLKVLANDDSIGVGNANITINYIVSDKPRYELDAVGSMKPEFTISDDSLSATVKMMKDDRNKLQGYIGGTELRVYGPALGSIETNVNSPSVHYTTNKLQDSVTATVKGFGLDLSGTYTAVTLTTEEGSSVSMDQATVSDLTVNNKKGRVEAGIVRSLTVTMPDACPATPAHDEPNALVRVQAVSKNEFTYNGIAYPAKTIENNCGHVVIGLEDS